MMRSKTPDPSELTDPFELTENKRITQPKVAIGRLKDWCQQSARLGFKALAQFNKTLENWMDKIANYFVSRSSNGRTEGFNHGLSALSKIKPDAPAGFIHLPWPCDWPSTEASVHTVTSVMIRQSVEACITTVLQGIPIK